MERSINNIQIHQITVSLILLNDKWFFMNLQITSEDGTQDVGKISKQWSGLMREYFTDADNFGVSCKYMLINMINYWIVGIFSIQKKKIELRLPLKSQNSPVTFGKLKNIDHSYLVILI